VGSEVSKDESRATRWLPVVLALLSFNVGAWLVALAVPKDTRGNIGVVNRLFDAQADEVDIVFIGSSRFQAGIDANAMNDELRKAGEELRAFNFGVQGTRGLEQNHILRRMLERRPERLEWVVLEGLPVGITIRRNTDYSQKAEEITARVIAWHTLQVTRRALAAVWRLPLPFDERLAMTSHHVGLWGRRVWNVGLLSERLFESSSSRAQRKRKRAGKKPERRAKAVEEPGFGAVLGARQRKIAQPHWWDDRESEEDYEVRSARIVERNEWPVDFEELDLELLAERARWAREAGVELIYLTIPCEVACPEMLRLSEAGLFRLLHYNDPERYPEFFLKEMREGIGHLNPAGAESFSRLVIRDLLELRAGE
jgi:hypothetical protein